MAETPRHPTTPTSPDAPAIAATGLRKRYGDHVVLDGIDLTVPPGTMLALLGPNGAGKTTTVRILSTLLRPDTGSVTIAGYDIATQPDQARSVIGLTGQYAGVDGLLTGRENLRMIGRLQHLDRRLVRARSDELLERFDLVDAADRRTVTYSGGMRRRLDLAASLMAAPPVLFLDEPTTGLDPRSRQAMWDLVVELMASGTTILLTTQYLEEADRLADRIAVISGGRIVAEDTAAALKRQVGEERVDLTVDPARLTGAIEGLGRLVAHAEPSTGAVTIAAAGAEDLRGALNRLAELGIPVQDVTVTTPTLDDVFMALTGTGEAPRPARIPQGDAA